MKNFSSLVESLPSRSIVVSYAKFDPPSIKHKELLEYTKSLALENNAKHLVFVQSSRNVILSDTERLGYLKEFFPDITFKLIPKSMTLEGSIKGLSSIYKKIHLVSSVDRLNESHQVRLDLLNSFKDIVIECSDESNYDDLSNDLKCLSESGDFDEFKAKMPDHIREIDCRRLMNEIRHSIGLDPIKEEMKVERDSLREKYLKEEIFNIDDVVESNGVKYSIIARGSNYLTVMDESGAVSKKWLHECKEVKVKNTKVFKKAKENMHYKNLAAYKEQLNEEPVIDTTRTDNGGQSILRYKDFKRLMDASNGIYEEPIEQKITTEIQQKIESVEIGTSDTRSDKEPKKKKNDTENVKILKPTNKVEEDVHSADYSYNPHTGRRFRAHVVSFKNSRHGAQLQRVESEPKNKNKTEPMVKPEN
jgi:hypothetical protein